MKPRKQMLAAIAILSAGMVPTAAQADYFVRPYAEIDSVYGNTIDDGLDVNGETNGLADVDGMATASIDLDDGSIHSYLYRDGSMTGGGDFAQAVAIFGDSVTFYGGAGTDVDFSFAFDGNIFGTARDTSGYEQFGAYASLYVFDKSAGANYSNFSSLGTQLVKQSWSFVSTNPDEDVDEWIDEMLSGTVTIGGSGSYDVFAFLNLSAVLNGNGGIVEMDFRNTATLGISTAQGVTYSSDSGVLLDSVSPPAAVPEPASWAMMIGGFALLGCALRARPATRRLRFA